MLLFGGRKMVRFIVMVIASMMAISGSAHAWWNKDWEYRKAVVVDTSPSGVNISGSIGRTLVLVRLHSGNFSFADTLENGADLRFVDSDDKTPLPYHIEKYDAKNGLATVWVSVPALNGGEKRQVWLYFANKNAPVGEDAAGSFDPDYVAAYHFAENPGQPSADSTANKNNSTNPPPGINASGIIGASARFPGQGALTVAETPSLALPAGSALTFTAWVKPGQLAGEQAIFARGPLIIGLNAGAPFVAVGSARVQSSATVKQNDWTHVGVIADGKTVKIYINGVEAGAASAALPDIAGPLTIGGAEGRPFVGELDEVKLAKTARPPAMLVAMAQAEGPSGKLVSVAETAEKQGKGGGTLFFIISKVEMVDAVVIGVCLFMLAIATWVMISKSRYLGTATKANMVFMKRFRAMHEDLVSLQASTGIDARERAFMAKAPLSRIYEEGFDELDLRRKANGNRPLSDQAVEAMRAAVDAVVVEENQKLDKWMVLLTIAISGGPFIGLLGTVMGVMNTFGGVAMAGDVNVNAIAPGIAAALLATISGLACAIPSLFGYNYLNSQITKLSDDMRVFVDRLITRLAEMQADASAPPPMAVAAE